MQRETLTNQRLVATCTATTAVAVLKAGGEYAASVRAALTARDVSKLRGPSTVVAGPGILRSSCASAAPSQP